MIVFQYAATACFSPFAQFTPSGGLILMVADPMGARRS